MTMDEIENKFNDKNDKKITIKRRRIGFVIKIK